MCGGAILKGLKVPAPARKVTAAVLWPEKNKPKRADGGARRLAGLGRRGGLGLDDGEADFEADFEEFDGDSSDSNLELGCGRTAEKDDDNGVVEIQPFTAVKRSLSQGIDPGWLELVFNMRIITFSVLPLSWFVSLHRILGQSLTT